MKHRFTVVIRGNVDATDQETLQKQLRDLLAKFPQFKVIHSSTEMWTDGLGQPRKFNDDGTICTDEH
ncbi:MAG: hypothetical protein ACI4SV_05830 [Duodenibacillus sp.]